MTQTTTPRLDETGLARARAEHRSVLAWYTTSWCGPCRWLGPILEEFAAQHPDRVHLVAIDGDENPLLCREISLRGFPTLVLFHRGHRVWQWKGAPDGEAADIADALLALLARLDEGDPRDDCSPRLPDPRPARVVRLPEHDERVSVRVIAPDGDETECASGQVQVPDGHLVAVSLNADYRCEPALDLGILADFEPGSLDHLQIRYEDLSPDDLEELPSLTQVSEVRLWCGPYVSESVVDAVLALPALVSFDLNGALAAPEADRVVVSGTWCLPALRGAAPLFTHAETDDAPPLAYAPARPAQAPGSAEALDPEGGVSVLCLTHVWHYAHEHLGRALAAFAESAPDVPVLVVDTENETELLARLALTQELVPGVAVLVGDQPVWFSARLADEMDVVELLTTQVAQARARQSTPMQWLPPSPHPAPTPGRTLHLPESLGSFELLLAPPDKSVSAATHVQCGGAVEVPPNWQTRARVSLSDDDRDAGGRTALSACAPGDLDTLFILTSDDGSSAAHAATLLTGLRTLVIDAERLDDDAVQTLAGMTWLRQLWILEGNEQQLQHLTRALPITIINGEWKA